MNIILVGGGKVGTTILKDLVTEGHAVVVVDSSAQVISQINNTYDVMCVIGNGVDWETLNEAGARSTNLLIAVTGSDEFNMLCCFMAKKLGVPHTVARIRNPEYNDKSLGFMKQALDLSMTINPDYMAAKEIFSLLQLPAAESMETFARRSFELVELTLREDSPLCNMTLMEMRKRFPGSYLVGMVKRGEDAFIPGGSFQLKCGDRIGLTAAVSQVERILKNIGLSKEKAHNIMIVGASRCAFYLAKQLISAGAHVTIIDKSPEICRFFAEKLPEAVVICGNGAQEELLLEEGLDSQDAFVTLTGVDEENILLSYLAQSHGVNKTITKIQRDEFSVMAQKLGLDSVVSPRSLMSNVVTRYARALENSMGCAVETLYRLMDGKVEALEFKVEHDFEFTDIPLKDMKLKKNVLIAGIIRERSVLIPGGGDCILEGDRVVILAAGHKMTDLADIME